MSTTSSTHGRVKRVYMQGDAPYRMPPERHRPLVRPQRRGEMVPFSAFATSRMGLRLAAAGALQRRLLDGDPGLTGAGRQHRRGDGGDGGSAAQLPAGIGFEWTGLSYEERLSGRRRRRSTRFRCWSCSSALRPCTKAGRSRSLSCWSCRSACWAPCSRRFCAALPNDVYFQVGLFTTIGLSAKNAILIVEFAKDMHEQGMSLIDAAIEAAAQRLRPILMTSLAFILGVLPLAISTGAGSGSQNAIGAGVVGGMISATVLAIFFVPVFFVTVLGLVARWAPEKDDHRHAEPAQAD